jgi:hypothetical protein
MEIRGIAQGKPQQVIFDLAHVTVLDSTGVGILVLQWGKRLKYGRVGGNSSQLRYGQSAESISEWKTVWRTRDDCATCHAGFAQNIPHEIEVHRVTVRRQFGPLRFEEF